MSLPPTTAILKDARLFAGGRMMSTANTNAAQDRPRWTHVLPAPVRSLGRPLLHKLEYSYGVSRKQLRKKWVRRA